MVAKLHATSGITLTPELARPGSVNYYVQISVAGRATTRPRATDRTRRQGPWRAGCGAERKRDTGVVHASIPTAP